MKFILRFETPQVMDYEGPCSIYDDSPHALEMRGVANKFIGTTEDYITIEFDTETGTATVVPI